MELSVSFIIFTLIVSINFTIETLSLLFSPNELVFVFNTSLISYPFVLNLSNITVPLFKAPQHYSQMTIWYCYFILIILGPLLHKNYQ